MKRDLYIDFAKGLATLSIIFIHTAYWSGQLYLPTEVRILSLLFDVPLFFALSGITSGNSIEKTCFRLLKLQITYMLFVTLIFFIDYLFKVLGLYFFGIEGLQQFYAIFGDKFIPKHIDNIPQWENLGNWYLHQYTHCDIFPVVMGSFWYLKVYFILSFLGVLILRFFPKHIFWAIGICFGLTAIFNLFPVYYPTGQVGYVAFYLGVFLVAHHLRGKKIPNLAIPLLYWVWFIAMGLLFCNYGADILYNINKFKFPPRTPYILWSLFSLITLFVLYNRLKITKDNFINYIGRNAIFYYFAQGISSTIIYFMVYPLKEQMHWSILLMIVYPVNIALAILIAELLKLFDAIGWKVLNDIRTKTSTNE
ncbi:acyltransferase family protein [Riemerella columbina]|uniref:acyltransferase family protein n=1 Tax=Riemerella columbina TaxID=103810 RepID=UPI00037F7BEB|nr:acyltransferase family protein [Riemerella columbina]